MNRSFALFCVLIILSLHAPGVQSLPALRIGTKPTAPFSMKSGSQWTGFTFKLFEQHIQLLLTNYSNSLAPVVSEYTSNDEIFAALNAGQIDVGLAAPTKTAAREQIVDFSHSFFDSGLQIMIKKNEDPNANLQAFVDYFFGPRLVLVMLSLVSALLGISCVLWILEVYYTPGNTSFFDYNPRVGILEALKWATLTLLNKPTKVPRHSVSKVTSAILSFASILFVAFLTATITVGLSLNANAGSISKLSDLNGKDVGTVNGSAPYTYLRAQGGVVVKTENSLNALFEAFHAKKYAAVVYDSPILRYHVKQREATGKFDTLIVGDIFNQQTYGIVVKHNPDPTLIEQINNGVLRVMYTSAYFSLYDEYFKVSEGVTQSTSYVISGGQIAGIIVSCVVIVALTYMYYKKHGNPDVEDTLLDSDLESQLKDLDLKLLDNSDNFLLNYDIHMALITMQEWMFRLNNKEAYFRDEFYSTEDAKALILSEKFGISEILKRRQKHKNMHRQFTAANMDEKLETPHVRRHTVIAEILSDEEDANTNTNAVQPAILLEIPGSSTPVAKCNACHAKFGYQQGFEGIVRCPKCQQMNMIVG